MSEIMSAMSTKQYRPSRRSWVKLWVNEWLTGTVRWQLTPQQRSMWADLLALAGNSRFPGIICSGETNGVLDPFPMDYLCSVFRCSEADVQAAFDLFVAQGRIVINHIGVIQIVNWDKYQSEYQLKRQRRTYKEPRRSDGEANVHRKSRKTPPEEVEVEGEVEEEKKKTYARAWPTDLVLLPAMKEYAVARGVADPEAEFEAWHNDCLAHGRKYQNWMAAWRTRVGNYEKFSGGSHGTRPTDSREQQRHERSQHAIENVTGHRSGLADRLREGLSGGSAGGTSGGVSGGTKRLAPGTPAPIVPASNETVKVPPNAGRSTRVV